MPKVVFGWFLFSKIFYLVIKIILFSIALFRGCLYSNKADSSNYPAKSLFFLPKLASKINDFPFFT